MKRWAWWAGTAVFAALMCVMSAHACQRGPQPRAASWVSGRAQRVLTPHAQRELADLDSMQIARHLAEAIRVRTISEQDPARIDRSQFAALRDSIARNYPRLNATFSRELIHGDGIVYHLQGSDPRLLPVLLLAHQDVVPVEPDAVAKWKHPPFAGVIADGFVWGRGAIDDKGSMITLCEAIEALLRDGWRPARGVWLAFGFDEEIGGNQGAGSISQSFTERGLHFAWALDEGGGAVEGVVPFVERPVAVIAIAEKGYLSLELTANAEGGHASMPPQHGAIDVLMAALTRLRDEPLPPRMTPSLRNGLRELAPEMSFAARLIAANAWLTAPLIVRGLARSREGAAAVQTTTAITILNAGIKENVVPARARAVVNFRIMPGESSASVTRHVRRVIGDDPVEIHQLAGASEPTAISSTDSRGYRHLIATLKHLFPDAVPVATALNAGTDAHHYDRVARDVYRFLPLTILKDDLARVHGIDERISLADLTLMTHAYRELLRRSTGPAPAGER